MKFNMHNMNGQIIVSMDGEIAEALVRILEERERISACEAMRNELSKNIHFMKGSANHGTRRRTAETNRYQESG